MVINLAYVSYEVNATLIAGMSDLLSPFIVLFEDNADAFWCFEMLLRRMVLLNLTFIYQCCLKHNQLSSDFWFGRAAYCRPEKPSKVQSVCFTVIS